MRYFMNEVRVVTVREEDTVTELRNFVRYPNGTWKARAGFHDDRVMAMLYGLFILEKEITERFFDIVEVDDELAIKTCKHYSYKYAIITPDDIVIPPKHDNFQKD